MVFEWVNNLVRNPAGFLMGAVSNVVNAIPMAYLLAMIDSGVYARFLPGQAQMLVDPIEKSVRFALMYETQI